MKKLLPILIILILLLTIKNNLFAIFKTVEDKNTAETLRQKLSTEEKRNQFLKEQLYYVETDQFVEEEAREKLGMSRPGEYIVIAPTPAPLNREQIEVNTNPNWRRWLELFF